MIYFYYNQKRDGANYNMLKSWLKKYFNEPTLRERRFTFIRW